jgi:hypothetical protein
VLRVKGSNIKRYTVGVYLLRHRLSRKAYVGSSKRCCGNRYSVHLCDLRRDRHSCKDLQDLWNQTSENEWEFVYLGTDKTEDDHLKRLRKRGLSLSRWPTASGTGKKCTEEEKQRMREGRARYLETPGARGSLSERAKIQHAAKNLGAHTWVTGPDPSKNAWVKSQELKDHLRKHVAAQTSEEMRRRCLMRRNIKNSIRGDLP